MCAPVCSRSRVSVSSIFTKMSCSTCQAPRYIPAFGEHPKNLRTIPNVVDELMTLLALHDTAAAGCQRCAIMLEAVNKWASTQGGYHHVDGPEHYVIGIAPMPRPGTKAARTGALGLTVRVTRKESWEHYGYLGWSRNDYFWDFDVNFELYTSCGLAPVFFDLTFLPRIPHLYTPDKHAGVVALCVTSKKPCYINKLGKILNILSRLRKENRCNSALGSARRTNPQYNLPLNTQVFISCGKN